MAGVRIMNYELINDILIIFGRTNWMTNSN